MRHMPPTHNQPRCTQPCATLHVHHVQMQKQLEAEVAAKQAAEQALQQHAVGAPTAVRHGHLASGWALQCHEQHYSPPACGRFKPAAV